MNYNIVFVVAHSCFYHCNGKVNGIGNVADCNGKTCAPGIRTEIKSEG